MEARNTTPTNAPSLEERAYRIRRNALRMGEVQGQGYIAQALGVADVLAVAWFHALRYRPEEPDWEGRDRFLLSIGHYAIALYAALIEAGIIQADGPSTGVLNFEPLAPKWEAFGWHAQRVDGNDIPTLVNAFDAARALKEPKPRVIICDTKMAKGVPFLETREKSHFLRVEQHEWSQAIEALDAGRKA
jgi:transketolase N-terminal domain/subunit